MVTETPFSDTVYERENMRFALSSLLVLLFVSCAPVRDVKLYGKPADVFDKVITAVANNSKSYLTALSDSDTFFLFVDGLRIVGKKSSGEAVYSASSREVWGKSDGRWYPGTPRFSKPFRRSVLKRKPDRFLSDLRDGVILVTAVFEEKDYVVTVNLHYAEKTDTILMKRLEIISSREKGEDTSLDIEKTLEKFNAKKEDFTDK